MTVVLNDPSFWPAISYNLFNSYWGVAGGVVVVYDWVLTLGQEIELIWKQRWSLITVLYLITRYIGIPYSFISAMSFTPLGSRTDTECTIMYDAVNGAGVVIAAVLGVIMITRLHAMYQRSRVMLIFLVIIFLAINITCGASLVIVLKPVVGEELILSGISMCSFDEGGSSQLLISIIWILNTVWEALALCLSIWIAVKHFRDLRRLNQSTGSTIGDCFRVLIQSHVLYFAGFAGVSSLQLAGTSPELWTSTSIVAQILYGALQVLLGVQMFVLGPRLILSVREYHAKLVADSDAETSMRSIVFEQRVHVSTSSTV